MMPFGPSGLSSIVSVGSKCLKAAPWVSAAVLGVGLYFSHSHVQRLELDAQTAKTEHEKAVAQAQERARAAERQAQEKINALTDDYAAQNAAAEKRIDSLTHDLYSGRVRLRNQVANNATCHLSEATSGKRATDAEARAIIAESSAINLVRIAKRGDDAIRQANALIDVLRAYNEQRN